MDGLFQHLSAPLLIAEKGSLKKDIATAVGGVQEMGNGVTRAGGIDMVAASGHLMETIPPENMIPGGIDPTTGKTKAWCWEDLPYLLPSAKGDYSKYAKIVSEDKKSIFRNITTMMKKAGTVIHCGDPDREGQAIVDDLVAAANFRGPVMRPWILDLSPTGVIASLRNMVANDVYVPLGRAARARDIADFLVGMCLTRAYSVRAKELGGFGVLSVGRVQSPTLGIIVDRYRLRKAFKPVTYYVPWVTVAGVGANFKATWISPKPDDKGTMPWAGAIDFPGLDPEYLLVDRAAADRFLRALDTATWSATKTEKPKSEAPPLPFNMTDLQVMGSKRYNMTGDTTLGHAQKLYEAKRETYPRTPMSYLPESYHEQAPDILRALGAFNEWSHMVNTPQCDSSRKSRAFNDRELKKAKASHFGIIPTSMVSPSPNPQEQLILDQVCRHYIAQFYPDKTWIAQTATVEARIPAGEFAGVHRFIARGTIPQVPGWSVLFDAAAPVAEPGEEDDGLGARTDPAQPTGRRLPAVPPNPAILGKGLDEDKTKPPPPMTEALCLKMMERVHLLVTDPEKRAMLRETDGIGTVATRGDILAKLKDRGYVEVKKKQLVPTEKGEAMYDALPEDIRDPGTTGIWESGLARIAENKLSMEGFLDLIVDFVIEHIESAKTAKIALPQKPQAAPLPGDGAPCTKCNSGGVMKTYVSQKNGGKRFLGCTHNGCDNRQFPSSEWGDRGSGGGKKTYKKR